MKTVAVFYGGNSGEHEVSLRSGASVFNRMDRKKFEVFAIGIGKNGDMYLQDEKDCKTEVLPVHTKNKISLQNSTSKRPHFLVGSEKKEFDIAFPALHGPLYEDGAIQGLFESYQIPYVGSGILGSALGMDKLVAKQVVNLNGVPVVPYQWLNHRQEIKIDDILHRFRFPIFVKPCNLGSSVGISKVKSKKELEEAISLAFKFDTKVLIEQGIDAREIEVAVLETKKGPPVMGKLGEIKPNDEFYSYKAKYVDDNGASYSFPELEKTMESKIKDYASKVFLSLHCHGFARVDFFIDRQTNDIYFNEINTIPGFTSISMYPKMMEAAGMAYEDLLTSIIELGLDRFSHIQNLERDFAKYLN